MMTISANFIGLPGDAKDRRANEIFKKYRGRFGNTGTFMETGERDVEYDVPNKHADTCVAELKAAGFKVIIGKAAIGKYFIERFTKIMGEP